MKRIIRPILLPVWWQDLLVAIPRIVCGYLLTVHFGADKFGLPWSPADKNLGLFEIAFWFPDDVANYGGIFSYFPVFFAWMAGFSEAVGGIFLLAGFQTRIASCLILATMLGAIFLQQIQQGMWNTLPALGFLWVSLYTLTLGSGRFGLDYLISKKERMKNNTLLAILLAIFSFTSCVQKSSEKTIVVKLNVEGIKNIQSVGIRGSEKPLSWDYDTELKPIIKDTLYSATFSLVTGYKFTEAKFTVNGQFELNEKSNRRIMFSDNDTTVYEAKFDVAK